MHKKFYYLLYTLHIAILAHILYTIITKGKQHNEQKKEVTTMKKIATMFLSVLTAIMVLLTCVACSQASATNKNTRTMDAEIYSIDFGNDYRDWAITTIKTSDGHLWEVEDYFAPRFTTLHVTFNTMGTDDITDDEIIQIVNIWNA